MALVQHCQKELELVTFEIRQPPVKSLLPKVAIEVCPIFVLRISLEMKNNEVAQCHAKLGEILIGAFPLGEGTAVGVFDGGNSKPLGNQEVLAKGGAFSVANRDLAFKKLAVCWHVCLVLF